MTTPLDLLAALILEGGRRWGCRGDLPNRRCRSILLRSRTAVARSDTTPRRIENERSGWIQPVSFDRSEGVRVGGATEAGDNSGIPVLIVTGFLATEISPLHSDAAVSGSLRELCHPVARSVPLNVEGTYNSCPTSFLDPGSCSARRRPSAGGNLVRNERVPTRSNCFRTRRPAQEQHQTGSDENCPVARGRSRCRHWVRAGCARQAGACVPSGHGSAELCHLPGCNVMRSRQKRVVIDWAGVCMTESLEADQAPDYSELGPARTQRNLIV